MAPGYVGKQRGALHISYERGFCDEKMMVNGVKVSALGKETNENTDKFTTKPMTVPKLKEILLEHNLPATRMRAKLMQICNTINYPLRSAFQ